MRATRRGTLRTLTRAGGASVLALLLTASTLVVYPISAQATTYRATSPQSERVAVREVKWTSNVTLSYARSSWTFASDGVPASNFVATNYAVPADPFDVSASGASVIASAAVLKD